MTKTVSSLVEEMSELKRDLHFSKQVITAKYNQDLDNTAHTLQTKLQEKLVFTIFQYSHILKERKSHQISQQIESLFVLCYIKPNGWADLN